MSSLKIQPLNANNRPGVVQLVFDQHMRTIPSTFNFLKLRPMALLLWTMIATAIFKFRKTHHYNLLEILTVLSGAVILAQGALFLVLLYEASSMSPGPKVVGRLEQFLDQDPATAAATTSNTNTSVKKRATTTTEATKENGAEAEKKENQFWVLEKEQVPIGCIGALVEKSKKEARLVSWSVSTKNQRRGAGSMLLKTAMDQLSKDKNVLTVKAVLQAPQVAALRLFHKAGFKQIDRVPEWLGEKVVLEISTKDWIKLQEAASSK